MIKQRQWKKIGLLVVVKTILYKRTVALGTSIDFRKVNTVKQGELLTCCTALNAVTVNKAINRESDMDTILAGSNWLWWKGTVMRYYSCNLDTRIAEISSDRLAGTGNISRHDVIMWHNYAKYSYNLLYNFTQYTQVCSSCHQQGHADSKTLHQQNPPILNWRCRLTQVDLYNGHKTVVVVCTA